MRVGEPAAERDQFLEHLPEDLFGRRRDAHRDRRRLVVAAADVELQDVERRAMLDDRVEDDVEDLRVDQVAFGLDDLAEGVRRSAMSREDRQRQRRLHVKVALRDFGERAIEHRFRALLERRHERQAILAELGQLQHAFDVDAVPRVRGSSPAPGCRACR